MEKIEAKAESLGVASSTVAKDLLLRHLRSLAQEAAKEQNCSRYSALGYSSLIMISYSGDEVLRSK